LRGALKEEYETMNAGDLYRRFQAGTSPAIAKTSILLGIIGALMLLTAVFALANGYVGEGIYAMVLGAVNVFVAVRIRRIERWARLVALVLSGWGAINSLLALRVQPVTSLLSLALFGGVLYLLLRPDVAAEFSGRA
jgi:hypothetical protein